MNLSGTQFNQNNAQGPTTFLQISLMLTVCLNFCPSPAPGHTLLLFPVGAAPEHGVGYRDTHCFHALQPTDYHLTLQFLTVDLEFFPALAAIMLVQCRHSTNSHRIS